MLMISHLSVILFKHGCEFAYTKCVLFPRGEEM